MLLYAGVGWTQNMAPLHSQKTDRCQASSQGRQYTKSFQQRLLPRSFSAAPMDVIFSCYQAAYLAPIHLRRWLLPQWDDPFVCIKNSCLFLVSSLIPAVSTSEQLLKLSCLMSNKWHFLSLWSSWWFCNIQTHVRVPGLGLLRYRYLSYILFIC